MSLSKRCLKGLQVDYEAEGLNTIYASDPYRENTNPTGYIRLSCADNVLTQDILRKKYKSINFDDFNDHQLFVYITPGGRHNTRQCYADFINKYTLKDTLNPILPEELMILSGTTMICDLLGQILFDEDDVMLAHSPYYHRFPNDFADRGLIEIINISTIKPGNNNVELDVERFEEKFLQCKNNGKNIKAILLVNPRNPDGGYFSLKELKPVVDWAVKKHNLFVILDEIYDLAVYDPVENEPFESGIKLFNQDPTLDKNKLVWMSGLSKNFSLPGLRTAVMYTVNKEVYSATKRFLMYQGPNSVTEFLTRELLSDSKWLETVFLPKNHESLKTARDLCIDFLQNLKDKTKKDIRWITPRAGFFILVDFSELLEKKTFEDEEKLHKKLIENKVLIVAGKQLAMDNPGWFRIVFSGSNWSVVQEGLNRIEATITSLNIFKN